MAGKSTHTYAGNPGYVHNLASGVVTLYPGDAVTLTDEEAESYGDTFAPAKKQTSAAPAADPEGATS
jgi:hypothetical protein